MTTPQHLTAAVALIVFGASGPDPGQPSDLPELSERGVRALLRNAVPAKIFLGGKWMEENPDHTRELAQAPHLELGNHSFLHPHLIQVSDERVRRELEWTQAVLYTLTGRQARLFRPPSGEVDERIAGIAAALGLRTVHYDLAFRT